MLASIFTKMRSKWYKTAFFNNIDFILLPNSLGYFGRFFRQVRLYVKKYQLNPPVLRLLLLTPSTTPARKYQVFIMLVSNISYAQILLFTSTIKNYQLNLAPILLVLLLQLLPASNGKSNETTDSHIFCEKVSKLTDSNIFTNVHHAYV